MFVHCIFFFHFFHFIFLELHLFFGVVSLACGFVLVYVIYLALLIVFIYLFKLNV